MKHTCTHVQDDGVQVEKEKLPKLSLGLFWNVQQWSRVCRACNSKIGGLHHLPLGEEC